MSEPQQLGLFQDEPAAAPGVVAPAPASQEHRDLAGRLPPGVRLGTSSWSFPGWAGIVYAARASTSRLARAGLDAYARHPLLRAVGIDRSYYAPLTAADLQRYRAAVPADFRFLLKAHDALTVPRWSDHPRHGDERGKQNRLFLDPAYAVDEVVGPYVDGLGDNGGVLLFQFAPGSADALGRPAELALRLGRFLRALPAGPRYAVELRSREHAGAEYRQALTDAGAVHCLNIHPTMPGVAAQAAVLASSSPGLVLVRWMLGHGRSYQEAREAYAPFDRLAREDRGARVEIAELCATAATAGSEAIVIINNKAEGCAPLSAFRLAEEISLRYAPAPHQRDTGEPLATTQDDPSPGPQEHPRRR